MDERRPAHDWWARPVVDVWSDLLCDPDGARSVWAVSPRWTGLTVDEDFGTYRWILENPESDQSLS